MDTGFSGSHEERYSLELPPEESRMSVWGAKTSRVSTWMANKAALASTGPGDTL